MIRNITILLLLSLSYSATLLVPNPYSTIQSAINSSNNGDTIKVSNGTYNETNLSFSGKEIVLISENGSASTIIDGQNNGRIFDVTQGETFNTEINGFTIKNGQHSTGSALRVINTSFITISKS